MLQDPSALARLVGELGEVVGNRGPGATRFITKRLGWDMAGDIAEHIDGRERHRPEGILTAAGRQGLLLDFLAGP